MLTRLGEELPNFELIFWGKRASSSRFTPEIAPNFACAAVTPSGTLRNKQPNRLCWVFDAMRLPRHPGKPELKPQKKPLKVNGL